MARPWRAAQRDSSAPIASRVWREARALRSVCMNTPLRANASSAGSSRRRAIRSASCRLAAPVRASRATRARSWPAGARGPLVGRRGGSVAFGRGDDLRRLVGVVGAGPDRGDVVGADHARGQLGIAQLLGRGDGRRALRRAPPRGRRPPVTASLRSSPTVDSSRACAPVATVRSYAAAVSAHTALDARGEPGPRGGGCPSRGGAGPGPDRPRAARPGASGRGAARRARRPGGRRDTARGRAGASASSRHGCSATCASRSGTASAARPSASRASARRSTACRRSSVRRDRSARAQSLVGELGVGGAAPPRPAPRRAGRAPASAGSVARRP